MKVKPLYNYVLCKLLKRQICVISMILILKKKRWIIKPIIAVTMYKQAKRRKEEIKKCDKKDHALTRPFLLRSGLHCRHRDYLKKLCHEFLMLLWKAEDIASIENLNNVQFCFKLFYHVGKIVNRSLWLKMARNEMDSNKKLGKRFQFLLFCCGKNIYR